jgi:hypothetical protein
VAGAATRRADAADAGDGWDRWRRPEEDHTEARRGRPQEGHGAESDPAQSDAEEDDRPQGGGPEDHPSQDDPEDHGAEDRPKGDGAQSDAPKDDGAEDHAQIFAAQEVAERRRRRTRGAFVARSVALAAPHPGLSPVVGLFRAPSQPADRLSLLLAFAHCTDLST